MHEPSGVRRVALTVTALGIAGAVLTAVAGMVLVEAYRPQGPGELAGLADAARGSRRWSDLHRTAGGTFLAAAAAGIPVVLWALRGAGRTVKGRTVVIAASVTALVTAAVTGATRSLVEWDQLALWAVTVGTDVSGYRVAAFDDGVRFILVDGTQVSQGEYVPVLLAHLGAPIVGAAALVMVATALVRRAEPDAVSPAAP